MTQQISLGNEVRDIVSGFTGIAIQRIELLSGTIQIGIQPRIKEGDTAMPDAIAFDQQVVEVISDGVAHMAESPDHVTLPLGAQVVDEITGETGWTVEKMTYLNGCVRFAVQPRRQPVQSLLSEIPPAFFVDYKRLSLVEAEPEQPPSKPAKSSKGGPSRRIPAQALIR